jgi:hypothetical protein
MWLDRFDHLINARAWNSARLALLERLLAIDGVEIVLVCEIDPLEFMHRRLRSPSDSATLDSYVSPEELDRWARSLMKLRKLWLSEHELDSAKGRSFWQQEPALKAVLERETRSTPALLAIRRLLLELPPHSRLDEGTLVSWIGEIASAHYRVIWAECTDDEKMLLWRVSYDGFIAPRSWPVAQRLLRRGLLRLNPSLRVMNESFRQFVEDIEPWREIRRWQMAGQPSPWRSLRPVFVIGLLIVGVALYAAQPDEIGRWMGLVSASVGGLATLTQVLAFARGRSAPDQALPVTTRS